VTQFLAELVTKGLGNDDLDYYRLGRFRQVSLTIAPYAAGEWALVFRLSTFFTRILQSIGMTAVVPGDKPLPFHGPANSVFAISEVMGFVVEARCPDRHGSQITVHQSRAHLGP
jgi:hypothetical protein